MTSQRLTQLTVAEWFRWKEDLMDSCVGAIAAYSWEVDPGEEVEETLKYRVDVDRLFVFARYSTNGEHVVQVPMTRGLAIRLCETDFVACADSG